MRICKQSLTDHFFNHFESDKNRPRSARIQLVVVLLPTLRLFRGLGCFWGVAKGSSVSWVAKFKGDKNSECKLSNAIGWSRSYKVMKLLLSAGK